MSTNVPYTSIKSVIYDLSTNMDDSMWNESDMMQWAIKGFRKIKLHAKYVHKICLVPVLDHTGLLPQNVRHINQVMCTVLADNTEISEAHVQDLLGLSDKYSGSAKYLVNSDLTERVLKSIYNNYQGSWKVINPSTNSFIGAVKCSKDIPEYLNPQADVYLPTPICEDSYAVNEDLTVTTTFDKGMLLVSYIAYATNEIGDALIPDDEDLKEAIFHYCMYRHWLSKVSSDPQIARAERDWHLSMFQTLSLKCKNLDMPSLGQLENIKRMRDNLVPQDNEAASGFSGLGSRPYNNLR